MLTFPKHSLSFRGYGAVLSCLLAAACSDGAKQPPPTNVAGVGGGAMAGTPAGVGGTTVSGRAGTGAAGSTQVGAAGTGMAGRGTVGPAGTGAAGMVAAAAGTNGAAGSGEPPPAATGGGAHEYHGNATRDGNYVDAAFTRAAAAMLKKDTTFTASTSGTMYAQPLYYDAGPGGKDLVITATESNEVSAFDAATGAMAWKQTLAPPATGGLPCGNISPLGVTGTPVIDAASKTLFVAAMTTGPKHQLFALSLDTGMPKAGWPADISKVTAGGVTFNSAAQNQRGALVIVGKTVYIPYGGHYGDCSDYHGWVVGVPMDMPTAPIGFASKSNGAGIWAPGGLASDGTSVFAATGNSMAGPNGLFSSPATWGHGDAILRLSPDLKNIEQSATKDFFAAQNWMQLDQGDLDIGGSGPVLFSIPGGTPADYVMALGKDGSAYTMDRANLGGMGGQLKALKVSSAQLIQSAAAYTTATGTFVAFRSPNSPVMGCGNGSGQLGAIKVESGGAMSVAWCAVQSTTSSPFVTTTDGKAESIVWIMAGGKLLGFNGENGMPVYTGGGAMDGTGATTKFQTAIVAKGRIFVPTNSGVVAYTLK